MLVVQVGDYRPVLCHSISVLDLTCFVVENLFSCTYVFPNIKCIFSAKSFSFGNLHLLTNFLKLSTVSDTVSIVPFH